MGDFLRFLFAFSFVIIFTIGYGLYHPVFAVNPNQEPLKSMILQGIELTINNQFDQAIELYSKFVETYPDHPIGYFYIAAAVQAKMLDAEDYESREIFYTAINRSIALADSLIQIDKNNGWIYFYYGSGLLYRSFMKSKESKWFSAYRDASRGVKYLERAVEEDSSIIEAYLGIGSYKYWKSARTNFLTWLPFISDEREEGLSLIRKAIRDGIFVKWVGRDQLCWVLLDRGDYQEALDIAMQNCEAFPDSRFFKWTLASATFHAKKWADSFKIYKNLLAEVRQFENNNHFNEIDCLVHMAEISELWEKWDDAIRFADEALKMKLDMNIRKRAKNKLKKALAIRTETLRRINP